MKYPNAAVNKQIEGSVIIEFTVFNDGSIINPIVVKSIDPDLDNEALRIIKMMPIWKPGISKGKAINVKHSMPFIFKLN